MNGTSLRGIVVSALIAAFPLVASAIPVDIDITINSPSTLTATGSFDLDPGTSTYSNLNVLLKRAGKQFLPAGLPGGL
jgi:hypothetical protein